MLQSKDMHFMYNVLESDTILGQDLESFAASQSMQPVCVCSATLMVSVIIQQAGHLHNASRTCCSIHCEEQLHLLPLSMLLQLREHPGSKM
jgi:hypothetical protein